MKKFLFFDRIHIIIIFIVLISTGFISCRSHCKDVKIPYEVIEEIEIPLSYFQGKSTWKRIDGMTFFNIPPKLESVSELTNTSEHGGVFKIVKTYETTQDKLIVFEDSKFINAGETVYFSFEEELPAYVTIKDDNTTIEVAPPTVKESRRVTKYHECNTCDKDFEVYNKL